MEKDEFEKWLILKAITESGRIKPSKFKKDDNGYYNLTHYDARKKNRKSHTIETKNYNVEFKDSNVTIKKARIEWVDFSHSNFSESIFKECEFINCLFTETSFKDTRFWACQFENCNFKRTTFNEASMAIRVGKKLGSFINCTFTEARFRKTNYGFPLFQDCIFTNCDLLQVDFNGSRFVRAKFIGLLDDVRFRGIGLDTAPSILPWLKINPSDYKNPMDNVDFSGAELVAVDFCYNIDLSRCTWPNDRSTFILIDNHFNFFKYLKTEFENWSEEDKRIAIGIIDLYYLDKRHENQRIQFVDRIGLEQEFGKEFTDRFWAIIKKNQEDTNFSKPPTL